MMHRRKNEETKHNIYICNTVYQLIVICNIAYMMYPDDKNTLILTNRTKKLCEIYDEGAIKKYFDKVFCFDAFKTSNRKARERLLCSKKYIKTFFEGIDTRCDRIFLFNTDKPYQDLFWGITRKKNVEICFFEEGTITYYRDNICDAFAKPYEKSIFYLRHKKNICDLAQKLYVYYPELVMKNNVNKELVKIPLPSKEFLQALNDIFSFNTDEKIFEEKVIFFEEAADTVLDKEEYCKLVNKMAETVGYSNFILKKHPRVSEVIYDSQIKILQSNQPWELYASNYNLEGKVLISSASMSCLTSKLIFKSSAKVLLLYPILQKILKRATDPMPFYNELHNADLGIEFIYEEDRLIETLQEISILDKMS